MNDDLARPQDITLDRAELVAATFLVTFPENTRRGYQASLRTWFRWCAAMNVDPLEAQRAHIELWMRELAEKGNRFAVRGVKPLMPATVGGMVNAVVGFYKLAHRDGYIVDDITQYLKRPKVPNESRREAMTRFELRDVLKAAKKSSPLDFALCTTLATLGSRISEVCRLDVEDLSQRDGYLVLWMERSKGNRSQDVPVIPALSNALSKYIGTRRTGPLFLKPRVEERLDQKSANRIVKRVARAAGLQKNITNHSFRHSHITLALNEHMSIRDIVNAMGYADARQISRYDRDKASLARSSAWVVGAALEGF